MKRSSLTNIISLIFTILCAVSCSNEFAEPDSGVPAVSLKSVSVEKTTKSVTLSAAITLPNLVKTSGFYLSTDNFATVLEKIEVTPSGTITFQYNPEGYGRTYSCKAFISNGYTELCSKEGGFTTGTFDSYVTLSAPVIESLESNKAKVRSTYTVASGITPTSKGFCYGADKDVTLDTGTAIEVTPADLIADIPFTKQVYVRSYVKDGSEVAYSEAISLVSVESISLNKSSLSLECGSSETLTATVLPSTASVKTVEWSSSNSNVATVKDGKVTAVANGEATITASCGGKSATCKVMVTTSVTEVKLNKTSLSLEPGESETLTSTVLPETASIKVVSWSSSNTGVATVSNTGNVTAVAKGTCSITVQSNNGKTAICDVAVTEAADLSADGTANCYIVNASGFYKFNATVKGGSTQSLDGTPASASVLWESFGTSTAPSVGSIVSNVSYFDGYVKFSTPTTLQDGNAVIAVKDGSGNILWSWHIWVCSGFDPKATAQAYNNNAGTMMDRNLGATSAAKGDVKALGLMYQWGRKDPFLGSSSISSNTVAASTLTWPSTVSSTSSTGTISYAVAHPTTFITGNSSNYDWYYTGSSSTDNTRWQSSKGIYDPCPKGWRVPDGGSSGVWAKAFGTSSSSWATSSNWDSTNKGMNFGSTDKKLGSGTIWYPSAGYRYYDVGSLHDVGTSGSYWSCTPYGRNAYDLYFGSSGYVSPAGSSARANGQSVRCLSE